MKKRKTIFERDHQKCASHIIGKQTRVFDERTLTRVATLQPLKNRRTRTCPLLDVLLSSYTQMFQKKQRKKNLALTTDIV